MTSPRSGATVPTGAHPKNTGGKKGRSGRPPKAWKVFCRDKLVSPKVQANITKILEKGSGGGFASTLRLVADHGEGVPEQPVTVGFDLSKLKDAELAQLEAIARRAATADD